MESSRWYKHSYPDVLVFQNDKLAASEDNMKIFASNVFTVLFSLIQLREGFTIS